MPAFLIFLALLIVIFFLAKSLVMLLPYLIGLLLVIAILFIVLVGMTSKDDELEDIEKDS